MLSEQLDAILHHPRLRKLEGSWRGLAWLVGGADLSARLKIKLLNIGWAGDLPRPGTGAVEFDQSHLFRKIYEEEFGMPGGEPFGLLIVDHDVRHRPAPASRTDDVSALAALAGVAAAAFCPVIVGASPALLEVDSFADLANVVDIAGPLRNAEHARWRSLAARADMRFVGVALPRLLARPPWQDDGTRADGFRYAEYAPVGGASRLDAAPATRLPPWSRGPSRSFAWPADVRGVETDRVGGGLVTGRAVGTVPHRSATMSGSRIPLEIVWNDRQERELLDAGLIPLAALPNCEELVFGAVRSLQAPQRYHRRRRRGGERQCAAVVADQLDPVRLALRPLPQDDGPPDGGLVPDRATRSSATADTG